MTCAPAFRTQIRSRKFFLKFLTLFASLFLAQILCAQTDDELLENFFRDNETASESDAQLFLENLEYLREHPLDLNAAGREDLHALHLLNELQLESFLAYRDQFGAFLNVYELQAIPHWELPDIRRVLQFAQIRETLDTRHTPLLRGFRKGSDELLLRWGRPDPPTYDTDAQLLAELDDKSNASDTMRYLRNRPQGDPNAFALRYRHNFDNRLRFGFTMESDAGERFFGQEEIVHFDANDQPVTTRKQWQGFDFYSAHLFAQNWNRRVRVVALGDYSARMGQGLLLQTGFAPGKSSETVTVARGGQKLRAYSAFGETYFFRGAATTLAFGKHLELTALYSNRRRDGNVVTIENDNLEAPELEFTALQTSGYHRSQTEIEDERQLREEVGGIAVGWTGQRGQITINSLHVRYDKPLNPSDAPYRRYAFRGKALSGASVDYNYRWRNIFFFGETARSDNGGMATVNGLLFSADRHVTLTALHRSLAKDYQSIYGNPFAEVSGASNEQGLYLGADIRWTRRWQINLYADVWRHPWLRFQIDAPSQGREFLGRILWTKSRRFSVYALWRSETKERNDPQNRPLGLAGAQTRRLRIHSTYKAGKAVEFRSRVEWTSFQLGQNQRSLGFYAYQEAVVKPLSSPLSAALRYSVFDADDFDSRVFAYENDLFAAVSIPAFSGRGTRWYANLHWRVNDWLRLDGRLEETNTLRAVTDSGRTGRYRVWKLQARMRF